LTAGPSLRYNRSGAVCRAAFADAAQHMPQDSFYSLSSSADGQRGSHAGGDAEERLIPFAARSQAESAPARRRRDVRELERGTPSRRVRRRRQGTTSWLQRNALSVAAVSILVAVLGLGFGLLQTLNHADANPSGVAANQAEPGVVSAGLISVAGATDANLEPGSPAQPTTSARREITSSARVLEPGYTVESGDTLGRIAVRFGTTVERIQALNNLSDPRALRTGTRLVIPPPL
jgi:nucleoid-associated protein YgaU